ncbi:MAG: transporter permease [Conexibacter sp.]|nr:transporter permease [Conexibacter sp.]
MPGSDVAEARIPDRGMSPASGDDEARAVASQLRRERLLLLLRGQTLGALLVVLIVVFSLIAPNFFSSDTFFLVGGVAAAMGIMAVAQTFLIIAGGIDVSVGGVVALSAVLTGVLVDHSVPVWWAAAIALLASALLGGVNGFLAIKLKMSPLIVTLATLSLFTGLAYVLSGGDTLLISSDSFEFIGTGKVGPFPFQMVIFAVVLAIGYFYQRFSIHGQQIYAIGGNVEAARLSGIRVDAIPFVLYVLSGLSAGMAGLILTAQLASASPDVGSAFLLPVVTAVVLGGASLHGGLGSVIGTLVAVAILGVLQIGLSLLALSAYVQDMALGIVLLLALSLDQLMVKERSTS